MYIVTTLSLQQLGDLIRNKRVSLDNGRLLFGRDADAINTYFRERIGYQGYVIGFRGRLNNTTASVFKQLDNQVANGTHVIIEAEIDERDVIRYRVEGVDNAATALYYGMSEDTICTELDDARLGDTENGDVEVLCIPYINGSFKVRVTSLSDNLSFNVEGITFVKLNGGA